MGAALDREIGPDGIEVPDPRLETLPWLSAQISPQREPPFFVQVRLGEDRIDDGLQENAKTVGAALKARLQDLQQKYEVIGDVRGMGLMLAIEMVKDRSTKEPDPDTTAAVFEETRKAGLIASKSGPHRSVIRMCPPLCLSMDDVDQVADGFDRSFAVVTGA